MENNPRILAVVVLYRETPQGSRAAQALASCLSADPALASAFSPLLYDNSPQPAEEDAAQLPVANEYVHDARNAGLPAAYNYALARAVEQGCSWLLLLDQDTEITHAYLAEARALTAGHASEERISAFAPKLESVKGIKSPTLDFLEWLRRQMQFPRRRPLFVSRETYGVQEEQISAFNSASILRVSTLRKIGGFPKEFWLDFLDVAVFHALHRAGGRVFVMEATLQHDLSLDARGFYDRENAFDRHRNFLNAMVRFVQEYGRARDRWLNRLWLLRYAATLFRSARSKRFAFESLRQAIVYHNSTQST